MLSYDLERGKIESERDEIVARIIEAGVIPERRTLAVNVVAESFVDRVLEAFDRGSYLELITWIDKTCTTYASTPHISAMLAGASRAMLAALSDHAHISGELKAEIASLDQSIGSIAFKTRAQTRVSEVTHVDEVGRLIHDLLRQMEVSDPLTLEHSHAVSLWCSRIARRLSLSDAEVTHVGRCGLVHDFGKMKIASAMLHAPRKLTNEEWVVIRSHPAMGEELVNTMPPLRAFASTVRSHHERLDGKGYPDNLVSSQIPLTTRIVTVADSFNAMIGRRPYRLPMSPGNALDQLYANRGTQFDPIVVEAMADVVSRGDVR